MNCQKFQNAVQQRLDDRLPLSDCPEIQAHAACCDDCHSHLQSFQLFEQVFTTLPWAEVVPEDAVAANTHSSEMAPSSRVTKPHRNVPNSTYTSAISWQQSRAQQRPSRPNASSWRSWITHCCIATIAVGICAALPQLKSWSNYSLSQSFWSGRNAGANIAASTDHRQFDPAQIMNFDGLASLGQPGQQASLANRGLGMYSFPNANRPAPPRTLASLRLCYQYTAELPGIRPLESSLQWAINALQQALSNEPSRPQSPPQHPNSSWRSMHNNLRNA